VERMVVRGLVSSEDCLQKLWEHVFVNALQVPPSEHPVLFMEPPHNAWSHQRRMEMLARLAFEEMSVPALYLATPAVLSLYESGRMTGVVLDSGHGVTHTVPVYEGYPIDHGILRSEVGGVDVTLALAGALRDRYAPNDSRGDFIELDPTLVAIKEKMCSFLPPEDDEIFGTRGGVEGYISMLPSELTQIVHALAQHNEVKPYRLPDGNEIQLRSERFECCNILINPTKIER